MAEVHKQVRTVATTTAGLLATLQVSHVALESTGIYWRPVFNLLEAGHMIILVNAQHMNRYEWHLCSHENEVASW
jgi:transposase